PTFKGCNKVTLEQTQSEDYQAKLKSAAKNGNVCARLGELSGGLLTIDLDIGEARDAVGNLLPNAGGDAALFQRVYAALNRSFPWIEQTLVTQGKPNRCQIWFRAIGDYPRERAKLILKSPDGTLLGELRNGEGDQWQSVLSGLHPDTG